MIRSTPLSTQSGRRPALGEVSNTVKGGRSTTGVLGKNGGQQGIVSTVSQPLGKPNTQQTSNISFIKPPKIWSTPTMTSSKIRPGKIFGSASAAANKNASNPLKRKSSADVSSGFQTPIMLEKPERYRQVLHIPEDLLTSNSDVYVGQQVDSGDFEGEVENLPEVEQMFPDPLGYPPMHMSVISGVIHEEVEHELEFLTGPLESLDDPLELPLDELSLDEEDEDSQPAAY